MKTFPSPILAANSEAALQTAILYSFLLGGSRWDYTSAKESIVISSRVHQPAPITHDTIRSSGTADDRPTTIRCGHVEPFNSFVGHDLPTEIRVEIRRVWLADLTFDDVIFRGRVSNVNDGDAGLELECNSILALLDQSFPALPVGPTCALEHYSPQCGANKNLFKVQGLITNIFRNSVYVAELASKPNAYFSRGFAEVNDVKIGIEDHWEDGLRLTVPPTSWSVGDLLIAFAGCDHRLTTCTSKFGNTGNFLGLGIGMPRKNPVIQSI